MVLLPKTMDIEAIKDYMPITLIHSIGKLIAKVLVNRLTPMLQELLHVRQNAFIKAFIKGRFIHGSFKLIHALAKHLHARKVPSLLLKVDIARSTRFLGCSCCKPCKPLASPPLGGTGCPPCYLRLALRYCLMEHQGRGFVMLTTCVRETPSHPCSFFSSWRS
jgi:hypothetical protein